MNILCVDIAILLLGLINWIRSKKNKVMLLATIVNDDTDDDNNSCKKNISLYFYLRLSIITYIFGKFQILYR